MTAEMLPLLTETERRTPVKYIERLRERLGPLPLGLRVLGSVARGDGWHQGMPIRRGLSNCRHAAPRRLPLRASSRRLESY